MPRGCVVLATATCMNLKPMRPIERGFFCDDTSIRYPYHPETISNDVVLVASFFPAWIIIVGLEITYGVMASRRKAREFGAADDKGRLEFFKSGLGCAAILTVAMMYGNALSYIVSEVMKVLFGTLRPPFLAVCQPDPNVTSLANCSGVYIERVVCTNPNTKLVLEMRRSFVSGHASLSAVNMFFLVTLAVVFNLFIAATRYYDNLHRPWDLVAGALNGMAFGWLTMYKICPRFVRHPPRQETETLPTLLTSKPSTNHNTHSSSANKE
ncbi:hypothetical protein BaRGS_00011232 [Batillaria attramentaria]|uniref:Phosphatidic acid phosphatase type 2/haloperoxidase domain-containing protein n=1 Tax=Batillaria attramentaria TaxID=370345 RepID=A0ABD0LEX2_9CAEN